MFIGVATSPRMGIRKVQVVEEMHSCKGPPCLAMGPFALMRRVPTGCPNVDGPT